MSRSPSKTSSPADLGRRSQIVVLFAALGFVAACTSPPPRTGDGSSDPGSATGSEAGGGSVDGRGGGIDDGMYSVEDDPLVNPESLFEPRPDDPSEVDWDQTLFLNIDGNPASLSPISYSSNYEVRLMGALFDGPFTFDADMNWKVNENVVAEFEASEDQKVFTTTMHEGLKWHDGEPWTAEDTCFTIEILKDERTVAPATKSGIEEIESCEVLDPLTFRLTMVKPAPTNIWQINHTPVPKHIFEQDREANPDLTSGDYYAKVTRNPIGSGPYKFVRWLPNDKIELERWEDYHGDRPPFKRVVYRIITDENILLLSFNKGDIDEFRMTAKQFATQTPPGSDFDERGGVKIKAPQWLFSYIGWNMKGNPFFGDKRVRHAMTHATDIQRMRRDLTWNLQTQAHGIYHPDSWMYPEEGIDLLPYDLDEASRLLDEAGWKIDRERGGWRYKTIDGEPVKFSFTLLIPQGSSLGPPVAAILQEDLQSIGVAMDTQLLEWATFLQRVRQHEFQAATAAWGTGTDPDTSWNLWHSDAWVPDGSSGRNYVGFEDERVDELFERGRVEFDEAERARIYGEIASIIYEEQPYTFLFNRPTLWGIDEKISGVQVSPRGIFTFSPGDRGWWVPKDTAAIQ